MCVCVCVCVCVRARLCPRFLTFSKLTKPLYIHLIYGAMPPRTCRLVNELNYFTFSQFTCICPPYFTLRELTNLLCVLVRLRAYVPRFLSILDSIISKLERHLRHANSQTSASSYVCYVCVLHMCVYTEKESARERERARAREILRDRKREREREHAREHVSECAYLGSPLQHNAPHEPFPGSIVEARKNKFWEVSVLVHLICRFARIDFVFLENVWKKSCVLRNSFCCTTFPKSSLYFDFIYQT